MDWALEPAASGPVREDGADKVVDHVSAQRSPHDFLAVVSVFKEATPDVFVLVDAPDLGPGAIAGVTVSGIATKSPSLVSLHLHAVRHKRVSSQKVPSQLSSAGFGTGVPAGRGRSGDVVDGRGVEWDGEGRDPPLVTTQTASSMALPCSSVTGARCSCSVAPPARGWMSTTSRGPC